MLNIPSEVKALFSSDTTHKNFHVHFPNGEYRDLNNEDVVSESVQFTESLCSQQYFKFGLAEASQIEFTAVGIPNVRGAYIECAIEIDCTRLGAAWAEQNPSDDTLPFLTPQTCVYAGKVYYRVPYGRFKVDECPRDHGAMWQRQITAYTVGMVKSEMKNDFIVWKDKIFGRKSTYDINIKAMLFSFAFNDEPDRLLNYGYSKTVYTYEQGHFHEDDFGSVDMELKNAFGENCNMYFGIPVIDLRASQIIQVDDEKYALAFVKTKDREADIKSMVRTALERFNIDPEQSGYESMDALVAYIYEKLAEYDGQLYNSYRLYNSYTGIDQEYYHTNTGSLMYFYRSGGTSDSDDFVFRPFLGISYSLQSGSGNVYHEYVEDVDPIAYYTLDAPHLFDEISIPVNATLKQKPPSPYKGKLYSFENAYSFYDFSIGFLELCGWFLKPDRSGALKFFQMSSSPSPIEIQASDWSGFWWDENDIDAIGQVKVIFSDSTEEQAQTFTIGDGNSVYTIEDNEVLKNAELDEASMQTILDTYFAPNASVVNFTPVDLEMRGLPYLESGDYIELIAEDGTTVQTYILSQTISGIQHLEASVTSTNGELLEVIEDE